MGILQVIGTAIVSAALVIGGWFGINGNLGAIYNPTVINSSSISSGGGLIKTNNLSDVNSTSTSVSNLGVADKTLSNLTSSSSARSNLGLTDTATLASSTWAKTSNNLSDVASSSAARTNLGVAIGSDVMAYVAPGTSGNVLTSNGSTWASSASVSGITSSGSSTKAYETLCLNCVIASGDGTASSTKYETAGIPDGQIGLGDNSARTAWEERFTPTSSIYINTIIIDLAKTGSPADNFILNISQTQGGPMLATSTKAGGDVAGTQTRYVFSLESPISLSGGTQYRIQLSRSGAIDASNYYNIYFKSTGIDGKQMAVYNGSTWSNDPNSDIFFRLISTPTSGQLYNAISSIAAASSTIKGIATATTTAGSNIQLNFFGILSGFNSLTPALTYYLGDTGGQIQTTPGTKSFIIGFALDSSNLFVDTYNKFNY